MEFSARDVQLLDLGDRGPVVAGLESCGDPAASLCSGDRVPNARQASNQSARDFEIGPPPEGPIERRPEVV